LAEVFKNGTVDQTRQSLHQLRPRGDFRAATGICHALSDPPRTRARGGTRGALL